MLKYWSLTRLFAKTAIGSSMAISIGGKERKWTGVALWALIAVAFAPMLWVAYQFVTLILAIFYAVGELDFAIGFVLNIGAILIFFFSLLAAPALFYFAKDVEYVLPLPLKPQQIIGAKFTVALAFEYIISLALMGVMFVALLDYLPPGAVTFNTIITFLTLPILPLIYSTILVMLLVRVTRFGRNPDRYSLFIGVFAIAIALGFSMYANHMVMIDESAIMDMITGAPVALTTMDTVFINNGFAARALASDVIFGGALHNQAINMLIAVAAVGVFFLLAGVLYFPGVIGLSESGAPSKKMTLDDIAKNTQSRSRFSSYLSKELRMLVRSPVAFLNCVLGAFLMPILVAISIVPLMRSGELDALSDILAMINFSDPRTAVLILAGTCAFGFLTGGMVLISSTSISREGKNLFIMKYLPVAYTTQLNAKAASGLVIALPALIFVLVPAQVIFRAPIWLFASGVLLTLPGIIFATYLGLYIDLVRPKLNWDNEATPVKQNLNPMLAMIASWALSAGVGVLGWFVLVSPWVTFFGLFGTTGLLAVGSYYMAIGKSTALMERLH